MPAARSDTRAPRRARGAAAAPAPDAAALHPPTLAPGLLLPGDEGFNYERFPFYWLARTNSRYDQELERQLKKLGTDMPARRVLLLLRMHGDVSMSELATHAVIKLSTLTRVIQRMRADQLVETYVSEADARVTFVRITRSGLELLERIDQGTRKLFMRCYEGLTPAQLDVFQTVLRTLFRNLDAL